MRLLHGDSADVLRTLEPNTVDAIVTDPPAGISFMGKAWDGDKGGRRQWVAWFSLLMSEALRVLKPGGHALVWALPRTSHWTAWALEDAGFEIRDSIHHVFGTGFPKAASVDKAIDKAAGVERLSDYVPNNLNNTHGKNFGGPTSTKVDPPVTEQAKQWEGWATALKPSHETWWLCRKPLAGTVAQNVLEYGTGALNIAACRVSHIGSENLNARQASFDSMGYGGNSDTTSVPTYNRAGRWPPNFLMSHSPACTDACVQGCPVREMGRQSGVSKTPEIVSRGLGGQHGRLSPIGAQQNVACYGDTGTAARFFPCFRYQAKPSTAERDAGLSGPVIDPTTITGRKPGSAGQNNPRASSTSARRNVHPTVKPVALMRWLVRLITPPGGVVLDPFMGSGSTGIACVHEGVEFLGIEREPAYIEIARARIEHARSTVRTVQTGAGEVRVIEKSKAHAKASAPLFHLLGM